VLTMLNALQPLYTVNIAVGLTVALCIALVATGRDRELLFWAAGFTLSALAFTLFGLRTEIPNAVSVVGGNASLALMFAMYRAKQAGRNAIHCGGKCTQPTKESV
jgi:hypothetical protein